MLGLTELRLVLSAVFLLLSLITASAQTNDRVRIIQSGTWALDIRPDPFRGTYPVITYLSAGTVIFRSKPGSIRGYLDVLTQHGFWVQIAESSNVGPVLLPIDSIVSSIPSDSILIHRPILCLSQTNRIVEPEDSCRSGTAPVGKGWVFQFTESGQPGWVLMHAQLDANTRRELEERGWNLLEAEFDVKLDDLTLLEKRGFITLLDRKHPRILFDNDAGEVVYLACGTKSVSRSAIEGSVSAEASVEAKASFFEWLGLKIGISGAITASSAETYEVAVDTTEQSYLYYSVGYTNTVTKEAASIYVEKEFDCISGAQNAPGDRIRRVTFEIDFGTGVDRTTYTFNTADAYMNVTDILLRRMGRPVFISVNSEEIYGAVLDRIIEEWQIEEINFAQFVLANINYSCPDQARRACAEETVIAD